MTAVDVVTTMDLEGIALRPQLLVDVLWHKRLRLVTVSAAQPAAVSAARVAAADERGLVPRRYSRSQYLSGGDPR